MQFFKDTKPFKVCNFGVKLLFVQRVTFRNSIQGQALDARPLLIPNPPPNKMLTTVPASGDWLMAPRLLWVVCLLSVPSVSTGQRQAAADGGGPENKACRSKLGSNRFTPEQGRTTICPIAPLLSNSQAWRVIA